MGQFDDFFLPDFDQKIILKIEKMKSREPHVVRSCNPRIIEFNVLNL